MAGLSERTVRSVLSALAGIAISVVGLVLIFYLQRLDPRSSALLVAVAAASGVGSAFTTTRRDFVLPLVVITLFWGLVFMVGFGFPFSEGRMDVAAKNLIITGGCLIAVITSFILVYLAKWTDRRA